MKVKSESEVAQSYPAPSDPMDCSLPGPSVHGIFQARVLEWGAIAFSGLRVYTGPSPSSLAVGRSTSLRAGDLLSVVRMNLEAWWQKSSSF